MSSFCSGDIFVLQMMFSIDMLNTKVVNNFLILFVLKFHDLRPDGLGVIDFRRFLHVLWTDLNDCIVWHILTWNHVLVIIGEL